MDTMESSATTPAFTLVPRDGPAITVDPNFLAANSTVFRDMLGGQLVSGNTCALSESSDEVRLMLDALEGKYLSADEHRSWHSDEWRGYVTLEQLIIMAGMLASFYSYNVPAHACGHLF